MQMREPILFENAEFLGHASNLPTNPFLPPKPCSIFLGLYYRLIFSQLRAVLFPWLVRTRVNARTHARTRRRRHATAWRASARAAVRVNDDERRSSAIGWCRSRGGARGATNPAERAR